MTLERMDRFFEARVEDYDEHMRRDIAGAEDFYAFTAAQLPVSAECEILDLGCGTGLELEEYFALNPDAHVTGIDLSDAMLSELKRKFPDRSLKVICGSYFDVPFPKEFYSAAVSVESLHHFEADLKEQLYRRLYESLRPDGYFILTDYFAESEELEREYFRNLATLKREQGCEDGVFYHYDTPLTVEHEIGILRSAGFASAGILKCWGTTYTLKACKCVFSDGGKA